MVARDINTKNCSDAWRRMKIPMKMIFSHKGKLERLLSNGAICGLIGEVEVVVAAKQWSLMYWSRGGGSGATHNNGCSG